MKKLIILISLYIATVSVYAQQHADHKTGDAKGSRVAECRLNPTQGFNVTGTVTFTETSSGVKVVADIEGLTPGKHGFHIHENGDCSAPDATSAGGHFNPGKTQHGGPGSDMRHEGDFGNLVADESGKAHLEFTDKHLSFEGHESILEKALIVHAGEDDLKSQPTGNSGARVACGVITLR